MTERVWVIFKQLNIQPPRAWLPCGVAFTEDEIKRWTDVSGYQWNYKAIHYVPEKPVKKARRK